MTEQLTRAILGELRDDVIDALLPVADKHGLHIEYGGSTFDELNATMRLRVSVVNEHGVAETRERTDFRLYAERYGLEPSDLDRKLTMGGEPHTIIGLMPKRPKYPIITRRIDGKRFKHRARAIVDALHTAKPRAVSS